MLSHLRLACSPSDRAGRQSGQVCRFLHRYRATIPRRSRCSMVRPANLLRRLGGMDQKWCGPRWRRSNGAEMRKAKTKRKTPAFIVAAPHSVCNESKLQKKNGTDDSAPFTCGFSAKESTTPSPLRACRTWHRCRVNPRQSNHSSSPWASRDPGGRLRRQDRDRADLFFDWLA